MSVWKSEHIALERRKLAESSLADASREQLLDRIVALETSLYKMTYSLNELDIDPSPRASAWMVSKLFPHKYLDGNAEFCVFDPTAKEFVAADVKPETMHEIEYMLDDSVAIYDGSKLADDFEILSVNQSAMCASIYGGALCMGDVREAAKLLWGESAALSAAIAKASPFVLHAPTARIMARAAIEAMPPPQVKLLTWVDGEARTGFGSMYAVHSCADGTYAAVGCGSFVGSSHATREAAQAAVQANYEARIFAALPQAQPTGEKP